MKKKIFIFGAGGQGVVVLDILKNDKNFEVVGFLDSDSQSKGRSINEVKVLGGVEQLKNLHKKNIKNVVVAIGDNKTRSAIAAMLLKEGFVLSNAIHPTAIINGNVSIGKNVTISAGAIICANAVIEDNVIINTGAIVEHEDFIGEGSHIAPGVKLAGRVIIGKNVFAGIGSVVIQRLKVGDNSVIGAGAVVLEDLRTNVVAVGVPAKVIKEIK